MAPVRIKRATATALTGAALASLLCAPAVPAASDGGASPSVPPPPSSIAAPAGEEYEELRSTGQVPEESLPTVAEASPATGFDMPSAAIGAATGAGVVIVLLVAGGVVRRRPLTRGHGAVGA